MGHADQSIRGLDRSVEYWTRHRMKPWSTGV